jgi:hypothetical protein
MAAPPNRVHDGCDQHRGRRPAVETEVLLDGGALINVTMDGEQIVIAPTGRLDDDVVVAIERLLGAARAAGAAAVLDVTGVDRRDRARAAALADAAGVRPASVA